MGGLGTSFCAEKPFYKLSKDFQSLIIINIPPFTYSETILCNELNHTITDVKAFVDYYSVSNGKSDGQVKPLRQTHTQNHRKTDIPTYRLKRLVR